MKPSLAVVSIGIVVVAFVVTAVGGGFVVVAAVFVIVVTAAFAAVVAVVGIVVNSLSQDHHVKLMATVSPSIMPHLRRHSVGLYTKQFSFWLMYVLEKLGWLHCLNSC